MLILHICIIVGYPSQDLVWEFLICTLLSIMAISVIFANFRAKMLRILDILCVCVNTWFRSKQLYQLELHMSKAEISEKHFSTLETRMRISHIQSRTSRRERDFLSPNLMLRDKTENNFFQSQASRRDRDLFFSISDYETRSRIF